MLLDILIPTNGHLTKLQDLLECISCQTLQPDRVLILVHKLLQKEELEHIQYFLQRSVSPPLAQNIVIISNLTADYEPGHGVAYDRNTLLQHSKAKYLYMIDNDNIFDKYFFEKTVSYRNKIKEKLGTKSIISPTIMRRNSGNIQSQGITSFSFSFPKYIYGKMGGEERQKVKMVGANSLFGLRETFTKISFDNRFSRCYEDIDFTYRLQQGGIPIIVLNKVEIRHMERSKTKLDHYFLGTPASAYERSRNRILFVKKVANTWQKIQYFGFGLRIQTFGFMIYILLRGRKQRLVLRQAVVRGMRDGLRA